VDYDPYTGTRLGEPQPANFPPSAAPAVEASDGSARATVGDDQFVRLWDNQNRLQATLYGHGDVVLDAAFSDDRHTLATVSRDGTLMVWDTNPDRVALEVCEALGVEFTRDQWNMYITDLPYQTVCR
jgi:WD40 repeat protein